MRDEQPLPQPPADNLEKCTIYSTLMFQEMWEEPSLFGSVQARPCNSYVLLTHCSHHPPAFSLCPTGTILQGVTLESDWLIHQSDLTHSPPSRLPPAAHQLTSSLSLSRILFLNSPLTGNDVTAPSFHKLTETYYLHKRFLFLFWSNQNLLRQQNVSFNFTSLK